MLASDTPARPSRKTPSCKFTCWQILKDPYTSRPSTEEHQTIETSHDPKHTYENSLDQVQGSLLTETEPIIISWKTTDRDYCRNGNNGNMIWQFNLHLGIQFKTVFPTLPFPCQIQD